MAEGPLQIDRFLVPLPAEPLQLNIQGRQFIAPVLRFGGLLGGSPSSRWGGSVRAGPGGGARQRRQCRRRDLEMILH